MAKIDADKTAKKMIEAAHGVLAEHWQDVEKFAESESRKFMQHMAEIALWKEAGEITKDQAQALCALHQRSMKMVYTSLEGISLALAEKAVNAAIDVIRKTVNAAVGWAVL